MRAQYDLIWEFKQLRLAVENLAAQGAADKSETTKNN